MPHKMMTDEDYNDLRILMLEYFSGESKTFPEMLEDQRFQPYRTVMSGDQLRAFLSGLSDPAGLIFRSGTTKDMRYITTRFGRQMIPVYRGEVILPDPSSA